MASRFSHDADAVSPIVAPPDPSEPASPTTRLPVTVLIPAYNRAEMLRRSLASVFAQQPFQPAEVIVVDDGSDDDTAAVAAELGAKVIRHPRNRGLSTARNTGLEAASCSWVALLDSDDEWLPHHLAHLWELRGDHVLLAGSSLRCGSDPTKHRFHGPVTRGPTILRSGDRLVFPGNFIPVSGCMIRREMAIAAGGFQPRLGVVEDMDLWLRMLQLGTGICSPRVSIIYHVHDQQMSLHDPHTMQRAHLQAAESHRKRTGGWRARIRCWEAVAAWDNLRDALAAGRRKDAAAAF